MPRPRTTHPRFGAACLLFHPVLDRPGHGPKTLYTVDCTQPESYQAPTSQTGRPPCSRALPPSAPLSNAERGTRTTRQLEPSPCHHPSPFFAPEAATGRRHGPRPAPPGKSFSSLSLRSPLPASFGRRSKLRIAPKPLRPLKPPPRRLRIPDPARVRARSPSCRLGPWRTE